MDMHRLKPESSKFAFNLRRPHGGSARPGDERSGRSTASRDGDQRPACDSQRVSLIPKSLADSFEHDWPQSRSRVQSKPGLEAHTGWSVDKLPSAAPSALPPLKASMMMRRLVTILTATTIVLGVLTAGAEAHGSRRPGSQIRFGGHPGTRYQLAPGYGVRSSYQQSCFVPDEFPKAPPWPPFCN
jgi:hypothetical protein